MAIYKILLGTAFLLSQPALAEMKMDKKDKINGISVQSGKTDSTRLYKGSVSKTYPHPLETVKNSIVNFNERCNNEYKDRREFTDKKINCKYHNDNLVETTVHKDIKQSGWKKVPGELERYVLGRRVYNRASFAYYEMIQVIEGKNEKNQKTLTIVQTMLNEKETKKYISPEFERDSAFDETTSTFILTEINSKETALSYEYKATTDHWILNKEVSVPQVFSSMSKSINDLVRIVDAESTAQSRDLASN